MKYLLIIISLVILTSCDKKGALEDLADSVIGHKQGIYIEIIPFKKEDNKK